ncbi:hypothetical protein L2E82_20487 [Cichorium intybus]|uniref:Uncharacterized protein n=1 Tax=Cichorium intybus TaxID=13427 RepID=A0ACB9DTU1_CICIN|nr:hypothetical protein L2E82_20487 [Cichorium intybus]
MITSTLLRAKDSLSSPATFNNSSDRKFMLKPVKDLVTLHAFRPVERDGMKADWVGWRRKSVVDRFHPPITMLILPVSFLPSFFMFAIWVPQTEFYEKNNPPWSVTEEDCRKTQRKANLPREKL